MIGNVPSKIMWLEVLEGRPLFLCAVKKINISVKYFYKEEAIKGQLVPVYCLYVSGSERHL